MTKMKVKYGNLNAGAVFEHNGTAFLKTRRPHNAVNLTDGTFDIFDDMALVDESDLVLVHQGRPSG